MATFTAKWSKPGAVFADGYAARADKTSLWTPEFLQSVNDNDAQQELQGTMTQPTQFLWDQATFTLSVVRIVTSVDTYLDNRTWDPVIAQNASQSAGWTWLGTEIGS